jgi:hypothetical protein
MSKKRGGRPNLSADVLERARAEVRGTTVTSDKPASGAVSAPASTAKARQAAGLTTRHIPTEAELSKEYGYVIKDLRKLLVLAGALFVVIIGAAVLLPPITL